MFTFPHLHFLNDEVAQVCAITTVSYSWCQTLGKANLAKTRSKPTQYICSSNREAGPTNAKHFVKKRENYGATLKTFRKKSNSAMGNLAKSGSKPTQYISNREAGWANAKRFMKKREKSYGETLKKKMRKS